MLSSYLSLYRPISSSRRITPFNIPAPLDPLGPGMAVSRYDWVYLTFSYNFRLSDWRDLISALRSEIDSNCFRSSCFVSSDRGLRVKCTSSSSALRCLNLSRWEVTIGKIDVSPFAPTAGEARPSWFDQHIVIQRVRIRTGLPISNPASPAPPSLSLPSPSLFRLIKSFSSLSFSCLMVLSSFWS